MAPGWSRSVAPNSKSSAELIPSCWLFATPRQAEVDLGTAGEALVGKVVAAFELRTVRGEGIDLAFGVRPLEQARWASPSGIAADDDRADARAYIARGRASRPGRRSSRTARP